MTFQFSVLAIVTISLIGFSHYFPWRLLIGKRLPRLAAYTLGTLIMMLPLSVLFALRGEWNSLIALAVAVISAGLATIACYLFDDYLDHRAKSKMVDDLDQKVREMINDEGKVK